MDQTTAVPEILSGNEVFLKVRGPELQVGQQVMLHNGLYTLEEFKEGGEHRGVRIRAWSVPNGHGQFFAISELLDLSEEAAAKIEANYMRDARNREISLTEK